MADTLPGLALSFVSGRFRGGEFPLPDDREVLVGREESNDIQLNETGVSRVHAKLIMEQGRLELRDLNSTNGTFVNGQRATRASLKEGDRVLIGQSIMLVTRDRGWAT
ncbi:MAG: FHA domain-containing protein [Deltaproteobacteria bacterium]|nr:FHA domain-containing protein [Deltaproteobacteria bacterium]